MFRRLACASLLAAACGADSLDPLVASDPTDLLVNTPNVWPSPTIPVCWANAAAGTAQRRGWVRTAVERAFEPVSNVDFTGWGDCGSNPTGVRLTIADERPHANAPVDVAGGGRRVDVVLNFAFQGYNTGCNDDSASYVRPGGDGTVWGTHRQYCISVGAVHELAHALGFGHEHDRADVSAPAGFCPAPEVDTSGAGWLGIGDFDVYSVGAQSYCSPSTARLSPGDIAGLQRFYGRPSNDWLWWIDGNVPDLRGDPSLPAGLQITSVEENISGWYRPLAGDFDGDGRGDVFWYYPGDGGDHMWWGKDRTGFTKVAWAFPVAGTYRPLVGDFDGDGQSDIFWYAPGDATDRLWWGNANRTFTPQNSGVAVTGTYEAFVGDFDGDGRSDVFWYTPGEGADRVWWGNANRTFTAQNTGFVVDGTYSPLAGDFDGDGDADIFWYRPGAGTDVTWWSNGAARTFATSTAHQMNLDARAVVGDFNGNGRADIFFDQPGATADYVWSGRANKTFGWIPTSVYGSTHTAIVGDFDGQGPDDVLWYTPGDAP